jgi:FtsZ-binding cell division protein ZapB
LRIARIKDIEGSFQAIAMMKEELLSLEEQQRLATQECNHFRASNETLKSENRRLKGTALPSNTPMMCLLAPN